VADTAGLAASRLGGKPLAVPPVEAAFGTPAFAALPGEEEPRESQGRHSRQAEPPVELLAVVLWAIWKSQRYLCIRQAGDLGAEAALTARWAGAQQLAAQEPPPGAAVGTSS